MNERLAAQDPEQNQLKNYVFLLSPGLLLDHQN
jgi:hypothetical protein